MTLRETCETHVRDLRARPAVHRVIVARADGVAVVDDGVLEDRERAAASAASLAGLVELTARSLGVDSTQGSVIYGNRLQVITRRVDDDLLLVVIADVGGAGDAIYPAVRRASEQIALAVAASV